MSPALRAPVRHFGKLCSKCLQPRISPRASLPLIHNVYLKGPTTRFLSSKPASAHTTLEFALAAAAEESEIPNTEVLSRLSTNSPLDGIPDSELRAHIRENVLTNEEEVRVSIELAYRSETKEQRKARLMQELDNQQDHIDFDPGPWPDIFERIRNDPDPEISGILDQATGPFDKGVARSTDNAASAAKHEDMEKRKQRRSAELEAQRAHVAAGDPGPGPFPHVLVVPQGEVETENHGNLGGVEGSNTVDVESVADAGAGQAADVGSATYTGAKHAGVGYSGSNYDGGFAGGFSAGDCEGGAVGGDGGGCA